MFELFADSDSRREIPVDVIYNTFVIGNEGQIERDALWDAVFFSYSSHIFSCNIFKMLCVQ